LDDPGSLFFVLAEDLQSQSKQYQLCVSRPFSCQAMAVLTALTSPNASNRKPLNSLFPPITAVAASETFFSAAFPLAVPDDGAELTKNGLTAT
jgi:hypothetical protein